MRQAGRKFGWALMLAGWPGLFSVGAVRGAIYHVDSSIGDDGASGTTPQTPWRTLDAVNRRAFQPGDWILLRAGSRFDGRLSPLGSGEPGRPIHIDMYGAGSLPRIDARGRFGEALLIRNQEYWTVRNLELTNLGSAPAPFRAGARVLDDHLEEMRQIQLLDLFVHDVNSSLTKREAGSGILLQIRGDWQDHFDGLLVERCRVADTDRDGICQLSPGGNKSRNVVFRNNLVRNVGGDGIKVWGAVDALVEKNVLRGGGLRAPDASAGIWPFDAAHTVIQYNEVSGMQGPDDGEGFDCDYLCHNTVIQYNYSHNNNGGFMLVCAPKGKPNDGSVIRYNISQADGLSSSRVFNVAGNVSNTRIYNNTIFVSKNQNVPLITFNNWNGGAPQNTFFANNIFYVAGHAGFKFNAVQTGTVFKRNIFYFAQAGQQPPAGDAILARPPLRLPGGADDGFHSLHAYAWERGALSPTGAVVSGNDAAWDILGIRLTSETSPFIGAIRGN